MNYRYQKVSQSLSRYVLTVLVLDRHSHGNESPDLPLFTNGMSALICKADNHISLFGQSVPGKEWTAHNAAILIAFFFKPFALGTTFRLSAQELRKQPIELSLWNAQKAMTLDDQLHHSRSVNEKVDILSHFISSQIQRNQRDCEVICNATDTIMQYPGKDILGQLLNDLNMPERTLQRLFKKYVGITANEYRKICQFYSAFSQLKGGHFDKLSDVAYANGYFDQSHYIRSFKKFTSTTPNAYLRYGYKILPTDQAGDSNRLQT